MNNFRDQIKSQLLWSILGLTLVVGLIFLGKWLFDYSESIDSLFHENLAKSTLQLAIIVILGGLVKILID